MTDAKEVGVKNAIVPSLPPYSLTGEWVFIVWVVHPVLVKTRC